MRKVVKYSIIGSLMFFISVLRSDDLSFASLYKLHSFKNAVDTCMRCYSDMLLLEERLASHEKYEELLDLLVGRIMRLNSYIDQLIHDYQYEATVSIEEIEYLKQLLQYMEITLETIRNDHIPTTLNTLLAELKQKLKV